MYKIGLNVVFGIFDDLKESLSDELIQISIKKSRINFEFQDSNLIHSDVFISLLEDPLIEKDSLYATSLDDNIRITFEVSESIINGSKSIPITSKYLEYFNLLTELGEHICQCPALEYVVSENFVKIFIDKPNISIEDLKNIQKVFNESFSIELQKQRAYCLFVKSDSMKQTTLINSSTNDTVKNTISNSTLTSDMIRKI